MNLSFLRHALRRMGTRTVVVMAGERLTVWQRNGQCIYGAPLQDAVDWLAQPHRGAVWIVIDAADARYQREMLPELSRRDSAALLRNRLQHYFPAPALAAAWRFRFAQQTYALFATPGHIAALPDWHKRFSAPPFRLAGIFSSAQLLAGLVAADESALVVLCAAGHIHLCFAQAGQPCFTRTLPLAADLYGCEQAQQCRLETERLRDYLTHQRWLARDAHLPVHLYIAAAQHDDFVAAWAEVPPASSHSMPFFHGLPDTEPAADSVHAFWAQRLFTAPPSEQFAPASWLGRHRRRLYAQGAIAMLLCCAMIAAYFAYSAAPASAVRSAGTAPALPVPAVTAVLPASVHSATTGDTSAVNAVPQHLDGVLRDSSGHQTHWINGRQSEGQAPVNSRWRVGQTRHPDGRHEDVLPANALRIHPPPRPGPIPP